MHLPKFKILDENLRIETLKVSSEDLLWTSSWRKIGSAIVPVSVSKQYVTDATQKIKVRSL